MVPAACSVPTGEVVMCSDTFPWLIAWQFDFTTHLGPLSEPEWEPKLHEAKLQGLLLLLYWDSSRGKCVSFTCHCFIAIVSNSSSGSERRLYRVIFFSHLYVILSSLLRCHGLQLLWVTVTALIYIISNHISLFLMKINYTKIINKLYKVTGIKQQITRVSDSLSYGNIL